MAKELTTNGDTARIERVFLPDLTSTTGAGKTGLNNNSTGLRISAVADVEASGLTYSTVVGDIEQITFEGGALGTYAIPVSGCRFEEVHPTEHPGLYEIQLANERYGVTNAEKLIISITGNSSDIVPTFAEIQLAIFDPYATQITTSDIEQADKDAMITFQLDHLLHVADAGTTTNDSIIALLASSGVIADFSNYDNVTDSLEAARGKLLDIETDTGEIGIAGVGLSNLPWNNSVWDAEVQSEVDDALVVRSLHLLVDTALPTNWATDITVNSALDYMADDGTAVFDRLTDSLQAVRDRGDSAWTTGAGDSDRLLMVDTTINVLSTQTTFTIVAGSTDNNAYRGCTIVIEDATTATQKAIGIVDTYTGSTKGIVLLEDPGVFVMANGDKVYILAEKGLKPTVANDYHVDVTSDGNVGIDLGNVVGVLGNANVGWVSGSNVINANAVSAIAAFFQDFFTVDSGEVSGAEVSGSAILEIAKVVWDRVLTGATHNITNSSGRLLRQIEAAFVLHSGTAQAGASNTITLDAGANANDDFYNHARIVIAENTGAEQERIIVDYDGTTKIATIAPPWITNPDVTSIFEIEPAISHSETNSKTVTVGLAQTGAAGTITLASTESSITDFYKNDVVSIDAGTGIGQERIITAYNGTTKIATIKPDWDINPDTTSEYVIEEALVVADVFDMSDSVVDKIRDGLLPTQNVAFNNIEFLFVAASDHVTPVTGATGTGVTRSIDGGAFGAGTGTLTEVSNGIYQYDASAADMNGGIITFRFTATGGTPGAPDDAFITIVTGGGV